MLDSQPKFIILDTNLFVLYIVGLYGTDYILRHKRCSRYNIRMYRILVALLMRAKGIILAQSVVVETSNLIRQTADPHKRLLTALLALAITAPETRFSFAGSSPENAIRNEGLPTYGVTDIEISELMQPNRVVLTDDRDLYDLCARKDPTRSIYFSADPTFF